MVRDAAYVDISAMPEVARLAKEVARDGRPRVLREADTDIAVISPAPTRPRRRTRPVTDAEIEAALAASWVGLVEPEELKRELDEARGDDRLPPAL
jgi:hypothetical protein